MVRGVSKAGRESGPGRGAIAIRPAEMRDLDGLLALEQAAFAGDQLDRRAFRHALRSPTIDMLLAEAEGEMLGYVQVQRRRGSGIARLTSVAVAGRASGRGLGRRLVEVAEIRARDLSCDRMRLEVRADNTRARALYESGGYELLATVPDYYEDGETAIRFEKRLT